MAGKRVKPFLMGLLAMLTVAVTFSVSPAMTFECQNGRFTIQGRQVPIRKLLSRIARQTGEDIYIIQGANKNKRVDISISGKSHDEVLKTLLRDYSYAVVYNTGEAGKVRFLEAERSRIPLQRNREGGRKGPITADVGYGEDRERTEKEKAIARLEHYIANLERRLQSGKSDALYERLIKERDPETVTHDREKLKRLEKKLEALKNRQ